LISRSDADGSTPSSRYAFISSVAGSVGGGGVRGAARGSAAIATNRAATRAAMASSAPKRSALPISTTRRVNA